MARYVKLYSYWAAIRLQVILYYCTYSRETSGGTYVYFFWQFHIEKQWSIIMSNEVTNVSKILTGVMIRLTAICIGTLFQVIYCFSYSWRHIPTVFIRVYFIRFFNKLTTTQYIERVKAILQLQKSRQHIILKIINIFLFIILWVSFK